MRPRPDLGPERAQRIAAYLDVEAPPSHPSAHIVFGTRLAAPAELVARRYHQGLAPLIILTGGSNRRSGAVEAHEHRRILLERDVPAATIRCEDQSTSTRANVELALPLLHEAISHGLDLTAICKWYHRRAVQVLRLLLPAAPRFHAVGWDPDFDGVGVTRAGWFTTAAAAQLVLREWREIPKRLANGTLREVQRVDGAWR